jgi:hypothetical protein
MWTHTHGIQAIDRVEAVMNCAKPRVLVRIGDDLYRRPKEGEDVGDADKGAADSAYVRIVYAKGMQEGDGGSTVERDSGAEKCCVCWEGCRETVFLECGHACACFQCAQALIRQSLPCPFCRSAIVSCLLLPPAEEDKIDNLAKCTSHDMRAACVLAPGAAPMMGSHKVDDVVLDMPPLSAACMLRDDLEAHALAEVPLPPSHLRPKVAGRAVLDMFLSRYAGDPSVSSEEERSRASTAKLNTNSPAASFRGGASIEYARSSGSGGRPSIHADDSRAGSPAPSILSHECSAAAGQGVCPSASRGHPSCGSAAQEEDRHQAAQGDSSARTRVWHAGAESYSQDARADNYGYRDVVNAGAVIWHEQQGAALGKPDAGGDEQFAQEVRQVPAQHQQPTAHESPECQQHVGHAEASGRFPRDSGDCHHCHVHGASFEALRVCQHSDTRDDCGARRDENVMNTHAYEYQAHGLPKRGELGAQATETAHGPDPDHEAAQSRTGRGQVAADLEENEACAHKAHTTRHEEETQRGRGGGKAEPQPLDGMQRAVASRRWLPAPELRCMEPVDSAVKPLHEREGAKGNGGGSSGSAEANREDGQEVCSSPTEASASDDEEETVEVHLASQEEADMR